LLHLNDGFNQEAPGSTSRVNDQIVILDTEQLHSGLNDGLGREVLAFPLLQRGCAERLETQRHGFNAKVKYLQFPKLFNAFIDRFIAYPRVHPRRLPGGANAPARR
jgi:hypothetical protein